MTPRSSLRITAILSLVGLLTLSPTPVSGQSQLPLDTCLAMDSANRGSRPTASCRPHNLVPSFSKGVFLEEDNIQGIGGHTDRNYTMGLGFFGSGPHLATRKDQTLLWGAERAVDWVSDHLVRPLTLNVIPKAPLWNLALESAGQGRAYSRMLSGTAFSPDSLRDPAAVVGDRPYAFLLGWTVARVTVASDNRAYTSEITLGTIGSRLGRNVQRAIHKFARGDTDSTPPDPKGWANQIHDFPSVIVGVPTARYGFSRSQRLAAARVLPATAADPFLFDLASDVAGEVGYYTGTSVALRARFGRFSTPFWAWRSDPLAAGNQIHAQELKACVSLGIVCVEGFLYGTIRGRATAYNALLQGYPGYDGYHISRKDINHFTHLVTTGASFTIWKNAEQKSGLRITYEAFGRHSAEFEGEYSRPHTWGGVFFTYLRQ